MAENQILVGLKEAGRSFGEFCANNRAHIFTGMSVVGTVTTGVLSARGGARSARKIDRRKEELGRDLTGGEKLKLCGGEFIAPMISGAFAIGGAIGSDLVNTRDIARANIALIASEKAYEKLDRKTKEVLGEKKARQVKDEIAKENMQEMKQSGVLSMDAFENAPKSGSGTLHRYIDDYSRLPFWSNPDYLAAHLKCLQEMMREQNPRGDSFDIYDKQVGVRYSEWLKGLNFPPQVYNAKAFKDFGWNRGFMADGGDDDPIEYFMTAEEYEPGISVMMITWEKTPADLSLGRLLKSNGM